MMFRIMRAGCATLGLAAVVTLSLPATAQENPPGQDTPPQAPAAPTPRRAAPPPDATAPAPEASTPQPEAAAPPAASVPTQGAAKPGIATANVNLRSGPGTDAAIIATIPGGSPVRVESCDGEWCAVTWNGRAGYAVARNLDTSGTRRVTRYQPPRPAYPPGAPLVYEQPPAVYYGPPVVYAPYAYSYYYGPRRYWGPGWGWRRRW